MADQDYYNSDKTLRVYRERYRTGHPSAGKLNQVWKARIKLRRGEKEIKWSTGTKFKRIAVQEAEKRLNQIIAMDAVGLSTSPLTFSEIARRYLKHLQYNDPNCSEEKLEHHKRAISNHLEPNFGSLEIGKINSGNLNQYFRKLEITPIRNNYVYNSTRKVGRSNEFFSASGINKIKQVARAVFKFARDNVQVINNVPEIPSTVDRLKTKGTLSKKQWESLLEYIETSFVSELNLLPTDQTRPKYYRQSFVDYTKLVVWTGLRVSEALRMQWRDFELKEDGNVTYCLVTCAAREKLARKTGEGRKFRAHEQVWNLIQDRKSRVRNTQDEDYIFTHFDDRFGRLEDGRAKPVNSFRGTFEKALEAVGLLYDEDGKKHVPYQWRHLHAVLSREQGKALDDIAEDIGNLTTTTERYYVGRGKGLRKGQPIKI